MRAANETRGPRAEWLTRASLLLLCAATALASCGARPPAAVAGAAAAADLYVSTRGDDSADGTSPARALKTISKALERAGPGTTVRVEGGTYYEQVVTRRGGREGAELVIMGDGAAVVDGSRLGWAPGSNQNQGLVELRHPYVRLAGLKVTGSNNTGVLLAADHLTVEGCEVSESRLHGVSTDTSRQTNYMGRRATMIRDVVIKGNVVRRSSLSGSSQAVSLIADGFAVTGNTVRDNSKEGIDIWLGARHGEVSGNTVSGNGAAGVYVDGASFVRIYRNTVYGNRSGIGVSSEDANYATHDVWVYNNLVYDNAESGLFTWDERLRPGRRGVQRVVLAHNTLVGNRHALYLGGEGNTVEVLNNLGRSTAENVWEESADSTVRARSNVWLDGVRGFAAPARKDYRLTPDSPAVDRGGPVAPFRDDRGRTFLIGSDFGGATRVSGRAPDAGAYEYQARASD